MTEMFGEAWSPMSVPDLAPDDDDDFKHKLRPRKYLKTGWKQNPWKALLKNEKENKKTLNCHLYAF